MNDDPVELAQSLLVAPGWARAGLAASERRIREAAALELATALVRSAGGHTATVDGRQLGLPL